MNAQPNLTINPPTTIELQTNLFRQTFDMDLVSSSKELAIQQVASGKVHGKRAVSFERSARRATQNGAAVGNVSALECFLSALWSLPDALERSAPLKSLVAHVDRLTPMKVRSMVFHMVLGMTADYPAWCKVVHLRQLACLVDLLPRDHKGEAMDILLATTLRLPASYQSGMLASLCTLVRSQTVTHRLAGFGGLLQAMLSLPAQDQAAPMAALCNQIQWLPRPQRLAAFDKVLDSIVRMPREMRAFRLADLSTSIALLNRSDRDSAAERMLAAC